MMIINAIKKVFSDMKYIFLASFIAIVVFVFSVWLPNLGLVIDFITSSTIALGTKLSFLIGMVGAIKTAYTPFAAFYTILIAVLFGINIAMIVYYTRERKTLLKDKGIRASAAGLVTGFLGVGCTTCGTVVIGPFLGLIGAGGLLPLLPLGGGEFGVLSIIILSISIYLTAKKIESPMTCKIGVQNNYI